jgi:hypothetical protein
VSLKLEVQADLRTRLVVAYVSAASRHDIEKDKVIEYARRAYDFATETPGESPASK